MSSISVSQKGFSFYKTTGVMTDLLLLAFWVLKGDGKEEWDTDHHKPISQLRTLKTITIRCQYTVTLQYLAYVFNILQSENILSDSEKCYKAPSKHRHRLVYSYVKLTTFSAAVNSTFIHLHSREMFTSYFKSPKPLQLVTSKKLH